MHKLTGNIANEIRSGYTGGAVDMYIPKNPDGKLIYCYDVNSLYPYSMSEWKMPVGSPKFFNFDITKFYPDAFGFFFCKITSPNYIEHPIIQTHVQTKAGLRTIAPLGTWYDMVFSEEMYNAMKFGYKFEVL